MGHPRGRAADHGTGRTASATTAQTHILLKTGKMQRQALVSWGGSCQDHRIAPVPGRSHVGPQEGLGPFRLAGRDGDGCALGLGTLRSCGQRWW